MSKREEVLAALSAGPVSRYNLLNGRKNVFRLAYRELLSEGSIEERGTGGKGNPIYVGLPGAFFPTPRYVGGIRTGDVALLIRSGLTEDRAREALQTAIDSPGDNEAALMTVLVEAKARIEGSGGDLSELIPVPHGERGVGRPKRGEPFFNPLIAVPEEFDDKYRI